MVTKERTVPHPDSLRGSTEVAATFLISREEEDFDGQVVRLEPDSFTTWKERGAIWHYAHKQDEIPIGTSIEPGTDKLWVWKKGNAWYAKVWFYLKNKDARDIAQAVHDGILRSCSISFLPLEAERYTPYKYVLTSQNPVDWRKVMVSEVSIVPFGANPSAILQSIETRNCSDLVCKSTRKYLKQTLDQIIQSIADDIADLDNFARERGFFFPKALGTNSGGGGYLVAPRKRTQADLETPLIDPTDRYAVVGHCKCSACGRKGGCQAKCPCGKSFDKGLESDGAGPTSETGEAELIDAGQVPPDTVTKDEDEVLTCDQCGTEIPDDWQEQGMEVCPQCGEPLADEEQEKEEGPGGHDDTAEILDRYGNPDDDDLTEDDLRAPYFPMTSDRPIGQADSQRQRRG
jgi:hypothetical protein